MERCLKRQYLSSSCMSKLDADNEAELQRLMDDDVQMEDTEVGRYRQEVTDNFTREAIDNMSEEQWEEYKMKIDSSRGATASAAVGSND